MLDKTLVQQARQSSLVNYLLDIGEPLVRDGRRYRHKEHDSLVFTENSYYWNSHQEHGNGIDYLTRHKDMGFMDAVAALVGFVPSGNVSDGDSPQLANFEISGDFRRSIAYLCKARLINYGVVKQLIDANHLYQEQKTNNIIFPIYDELGQFVGAEMQGTLSDRRFKGIKAGSKYGYGFNVRFGGTFDYALFFESAVDLLSFIDLKRNYEKKNLDRCILISMAGLKVNVLKRVLRVFIGDLSVFICVDNDNAGQEFKNAVKGLKIDFREFQPDRRFKDWNDQLKSLKTNISS